MEDITPGLIASIKKDFNSRLMASTVIRRLSRKISNGTATYSDAMRYATEIGNLRAKTIKNQISSDILPDGRMYCNIAEQVINDSLGSDYKAIQEICNVAQKNKNKAMKIGLKPFEESIDQDNIDSIIDMVSASENYDDYSKMFETACGTFAKTVVDRNMKANASNQARLGLKIVIQRIAGAGCCDWCSGLAGTYTIGKAPDDVWAHHNGCTCSVDYDKN